jgi:TIR domain
VARIFLSYRRDDSAGHAHRLYDWLSARFGEDSVFMDLVAIEPGENFAAAIQRSVGSVDVLLAVIGKGWLTALDPRSENRRLDDAPDYVRLEIKVALERKIRVIPVLVGDATIPAAEDLPEDLKALAQRNALELNEPHWKDGVDRLIKTIGRVLDEDARPGAQADGMTGVTQEECELRAAADRCLEHLTKIRLARDRGDSKMVDDEIYHLGKDAAEYAEAARSASDSRQRQFHRVLLDQIHPIVAHGLAGLDRLIEDLVAATV